MHLIRYSIVRKIKNFNILFWPFIFPLILGTLFYFAFGNIDEADFETVPVAVVEESDSDRTLQEYLEEIQLQGIIRICEMTEEEAKRALESQEVSGILYVADKPWLEVGDSGFSQSILQSVLENYLNGKQTMETIGDSRPFGIPAALSRITDYRSMVQQVSLGGRTTDGNSSFFYALMAMACLYGCFIGHGSAMWLQANLSALAARQCSSPTHRLTMIMTELISSFLLHFFNVLILLVYLRYVLHMDFQGQIPEMLLIVFVGCIMGVTLGIMVSSIGRWAENIKIGIMLGITMTASFLSGLMFGEMKYIVDQHVPLLNKINPAALIADAFYCINVYDDPERLKQNLCILSVMCVVMLAVTFFVIRRERYDSI